MTIPDERNEIGRQNVQITSADFEKIKREMTGESIVEDSDSRSSTMYKMLTKDNPFFRNAFKVDDYDPDLPGVHIIEITETISHYYKVPAQSYDEAFNKYLASGQKKDSEYYDGQKDWSSEHAYLGRFAPEDEEDENESLNVAYKNLVTEWNKKLEGIE